MLSQDKRFPSKAGATIAIHFVQPEPTTLVLSTGLFGLAMMRRRKLSRSALAMMTTVGYARVSSLGQDLAVQLEKLKACDKVFKEKRSGVDAGRPSLKACLEYLREGDTLLITKLDRLARSTPDLYRIVSQLAERGVAFKVVDDPSIDTSTRTGKLIMGILALIAEFENDIRRE